MPPHSSPMRRLFAGVLQVRFYSAPVERSIPAAKQKYIPTSGTYPKGFLAGSSHAGVKASNTKYDDIALVVSSEAACVAGAVTTRNLFQAAPIVISAAILKSRSGAGIRSVIVNSGCANAVTGTQGKNDAVDMANTSDRCFDPSTPELQDGRWGHGAPPRTLVMSTGVIGQLLPMDRIKEAIPKAHASLGSTHENWMAAAHAICTTDTFPKLISRTFTLPSHPETEYRIAGMTKGAGMIHPNMGTLLGIICTDAKIAPGSIKSFLQIGTNSSFNRISIDGDTSTNDTVALLANGAAAPPNTEPLEFIKPSKHPSRSASNSVFKDSANAASKSAAHDSEAFQRVLNQFMEDLAQLVVRDGEGATKFVTIRVLSSRSRLAARRAASSIATSALVKTALYGKDANWGRILCAIGYAPGIMRLPGLGLPHDSNDQVFPFNTSVSFVPPKESGMEELPVFVKGDPQNVDEVQAKKILELEDIEILVKLDDVDTTAQTRGNGEVLGTIHEAIYWTCDFSHEYVTINGDYRT